MANEQNLIPYGKGNRSESEEREMRSRGGKRSGETRRRKAALRDTMNRLLTMQVEVDGFPMMPETTQKLVKNAVCAQIEYLDANGGAEMDMGNGMSGATLGKFSYSGTSSGTGSTEQSIFSPRAERILWPTGLTYRGGTY